MTKYLKYKVRAVVLHPAILAWSIGFVLFWVVLWVFVFSKGLLEYRGQPWYAEAVKSDIGLAYGSLGLIALGSVATGLADGVHHASISIRYITKYTRLGPRKFILEDTLASLVSLAIVASIIILATITLAWVRFGVLAAPKKPLWLAFDLILVGVLLYELSLLLGYLTVLVGRPRLRGFIAMAPLLLSFIAYATIFTDLGNTIAYVFPFNSFLALAVYHSTALEPPGSGFLWWVTGYYTGSQAYSPVDIPLLYASLVLWILALATLLVIIVRRARGIPVEATRIS